MAYGVVYKAEFSDEMVYIGQTAQNPPSTRWAQHMHEAEAPSDELKHFHRAIARYGEPSWSILCEAENADVLDALEALYIEQYDATNPKKGYNTIAGKEAPLRIYRAALAHARIELRNDLDSVQEHPAFVEEVKSFRDEEARYRGEEQRLTEEVEGLKLDVSLGLDWETSRADKAEAEVKRLKDDWKVQAKAVNDATDKLEAETKQRIDKAEAASRFVSAECKRKRSFWLKAWVLTAALAVVMYFIGQQCADVVTNTVTVHEHDTKTVTVQVPCPAPKPEAKAEAKHKYTIVETPDDTSNRVVTYNYARIEELGCFDTHPCYVHTIAELKRGDEVKVLSEKIRTPSGINVYKVRFQKWVGYVNADYLGEN